MTVTAKISEIDYDSGYVKVVLTDRDNMVSDWIPMMSQQYEMPNVGDIVTCDFTDDTCHSGFCKGKYFNEQNIPTKTGKDVFFKKLLNDAEIEYNRQTKEMTITVNNIKLICENVRVKGNFTIKGNLLVDGDIHTNGNVTATGTITSAVPPQLLEGVDIS